MTGNPIRDLWGRTQTLPGGRRLFSVLLGRMVPYTGSISPRVEELRDGYARVSMADRRGLRNHLRSIHAIAVMNLAEVTGGLALNYGLPADARAILTGLSIDYFKKARGRLTAEATIEIPGTNERQEYEYETVIRDREGDEVARARARWLVGPQE
jgi:acyl-coenzyme A thioesterase PaaI-like protein